MRSALLRWLTPLLVSLGLHGGTLLALFVALHRALPAEKKDQIRADAWLGNGIEVDAVAVPAAEPQASEPQEPRAEPAQAPEPRTLEQQAEQAQALEPRAAARSRGVPQQSVAPAQPQPRDAKKMPPPHPRPLAKSAAEGRAESRAERTALGGSGVSYGASGLPPGVRSLPSAFTRAIPPAVSSDPIWQSLPLGAGRPFTIAIAIDDNARISAAEIVPDKSGRQPDRPALLLRERVVSLLGRGLFALQSDTGAGRELFRITITLSDRPVRDEDDPAQHVERGFDPPRRGAPGHAYFTLVSGRHFDAEVRVLSQP